MNKIHKIHKKLLNSVDKNEFQDSQNFVSFHLHIEKQYKKFTTIITLIPLVQFAMENLIYL